MKIFCALVILSLIAACWGGLFSGWGKTKYSTKNDWMDDLLMRSATLYGKTKNVDAVRVYNDILKLKDSGKSMTTESGLQWEKEIQKYGEGTGELRTCVFGEKNSEELEFQCLFP